MSGYQPVELPTAVQQAFAAAVQDASPEGWAGRVADTVSALNAAAVAPGGGIPYADLGSAIIRQYHDAEGCAAELRDLCAGTAMARAGVHRRALELLSRVAAEAQPADESPRAEHEKDRRREVTRTWAALELGFVNYRLGDLQQAHTLLTGAVGQAMAMGNRHLEARGHHYMGLVCERRRDRDAARTHLEQALRLFSEAGSQAGEAEVYDSLGLLNIQSGDLDQAEGWFERSLMLKQEIGDRFGTAITFGQLGRLHAERGNYDHAVSFLERDLELSREFGDLNARMIVLNNLGDVHLAREEPQRALDCYRQSLRLAEQTGFERGAGFANLCLTKALLALGRVEEASAAADGSEASFTGTGERPGLAALLTQRAIIEARRQNYGLAAERHDEAIAAFRALDMPGPLANALFECGLMFRDLGNVERAAPYLREAIATAERLQSHKLAARYREAVDSVEGRAWLEAVMELRNAQERLAAEHRELQRRDAQLEWLTEMVVHDLKSPLQGITGAIESALDEEGDQGFRNEMLTIARHSAEVLYGMVNDMLTVLRAKSAELQPRRQPGHVGELIGLVIDQLRATSLKGGVELAYDVPRDLPTVYADRELLRRVLVNLVGNALNHTVRGTVRVTASVQGQDVVVNVQDTGPGIPPEIQDRVFDMWFHAEEAAQDRRVRGTGLGLPFCKAAVEAHGGRIWVTSEPGQGATFSFRLPLKPAPR